ncbi:MAG: DUF11 domain-containing protein [Chromatiales bacterium]|nr:DUF11 domain-containing protein [Chromatiales bacterium]
MLSQPATSALASNGIFVDSGQALGANDTYDIALADVDGDGDLDLITGNYGPSNTRKANRVWFNDGAGNFTDSGQTLGTDDTFQLAVGDVDGDGDIDFVAANVGQADRVYLNDGTGSFTDNGQTLDTGFTAGVVLADLDGDGDLDLATGNISQANKIFFNDGSGNFTDSGQSLGNSFTLVLVSGDVDGDGDIDLFEGTGSNQSDRIWLNDGAGTFTDSGQSITSSRTVEGALVDVDGDGDLDLVSATASGTRLRLNDGSGVFTAGVVSLGSTSSYDVALVDVDGDGDLDIIEGNYDNQPNRVLLNDGSGSFSDSGQALGTENTTAVAAGDLDGDGDQDFITGTYPQQGNLVWLNVDVDFGDAPAPYPTSLADDGARHGILPSRPRLGALVDGETDGTPSAGADADDTTDSDDEDGVSFGTLQVGDNSASVTVNVQGTAGKLDAWIDFNHDGSWGGSGEHIVDSVDLVLGDNLLTFPVPAGSPSTTSVARFRISSAGNLGVAGIADDGEVEDYAITLAAPGGTGNFADSGQSLGANDTYDIALADVDGDGDLDLITGNYGPSNTRKANRVWLNDGAGNFTDSGQTLGTDDTFQLAVGDVDGDGDIDFVAANVGQADRVYLNDGTGSFTDNGQALDTGFTAGVVLADFDGDGDLDLATGNISQANKIFFNDGSGSFTDSGQSLGSSFTLVLVSGDVDGDGDIDLFEGTGSNQSDRIWLNDGAGSFTDSGQSITSSRTVEGALADVDGDGDLDLVSATASGTRLRLNDGSGVFTAGVVSLGSTSSYDVALVDVDGDGDLDIIEGNYNNQPDRVLLNDGSGSFSDSGQSLGTENTTALAAGDLDGDGDLDFVTGTYPQQANLVWLNVTPSVQLSKSGTWNDTSMDGLAQPGETISYSLEVQNSGSVSLTNVSLSDPLVTTITCPGGNPIPSLANGATQTCTASYLLTQGDIDAGQVDNTATVSATPPLGANVSAQDSASTPLPGSSTLLLSVTGTFNDESMDGFAQTGETIGYDLAVTNTGTRTLTAIAVSDPLLGMSVSCPTGNPIPSLSPGNTANCSASYTITQTDIDNGSVASTSSASGSDPSSAPISTLGGETVALGQAADLRLSKTIDDNTPFAGQTVVFTLLVENVGPASATDTNVTDTLPAGLTWVGDTCAAGPPVGSLLTWNVGNLTPSAFASCTVTTKISADTEGERTNTATASSTLTDPTPADANASVSFEVQRIAPVPVLSTLGATLLAIGFSLIGLFGLRRDRSRR